MRETECPRCHNEAVVICYRRDDPVLSCDNCGSFVMTMDEQFERDVCYIGIDNAFRDMQLEVIQLRKTWFGRIKLYFKIKFGGFHYHNMEQAVKLSDRNLIMRNEVNDWS